MCCVLRLLVTLIFVSSLRNVGSNVMDFAVSDKNSCLMDLRVNDNERCSTENGKKKFSNKRYMTVADRYNHSTIPIIIDMSNRVTHQITSYIVMIYLKEVLSYAQVEVVDSNSFIDTGDILNRLNTTHNRLSDVVLNTEFWLSPEENLNYTRKDDTNILQYGAIGPPGRYGWFIPKVLHRRNESTDVNWKTFTFTDERFALNQSEIEGLKDFTKDSQSRYYCDEQFCVEGTYTPSACDNQHCSVLLAGHVDSTKFVVRHIEELGLLVRVVWLGPHLPDVVTNLTTRFTNSSRSLVFLSSMPSVLVPVPDHPSYTSVTFPTCQQFYTDCRYDLHKRLKLSTSIFENGAHFAFESYKRISFDSEGYTRMLELYKNASVSLSSSKEAARAAACGWLRTNTDKWDSWSPWYMDTEDYRPVLYIQGIFNLQSHSSTIVHNESIAARVAKYAEKAVNKNKCRDYKLIFRFNDGRCEQDMVLQQFVDQIYHDRFKQVVGFVGPSCSDTVEALVGLAQRYQTVVISYNIESSSFSDRTKFPYFFRTIGETNQYQQVYLQLLRDLGWRRLAALTQDGHKHTEYLTNLQDLLSSHGYQFVTHRKFPAVRDQYNMTNYLKELKDKSVRIIIGDVNVDAAREMMCEAYKLQMTAVQSYVWFLPARLPEMWYDTEHYKGTFRVSCSTEQMTEAINGHLSLAHAPWAPDDAIMQTNQTVKQWKDTFPFILTDSAGYAYDAVWMYALALDQLSREDPSALVNLHSINTTRKFVKILENTEFNGVTGHVRLRGNTRISVVEVRQWVDYKTHIVGTFEPNMSNPLTGILKLNKTKLIWLNNEKRLPSDGRVHCYFGLEVDDCESVMMNVIVLCLLVIVTVLVVAIYLVRRSYGENIRLHDEIFKRYGLNVQNLETLEEKIIPRENVDLHSKLGEGAFGKVFRGTLRLVSPSGNNILCPVAVKCLKQCYTSDEKLEFLFEAHIMKELNHPNIVKFYGVCVKTPIYNVMELMLYGDLKNFLLARRHYFKDDQNMKEHEEKVSNRTLTTMALEVARALSYLANLKFVHRDVACRNCMVGDRRVVKLGDFGMTRRMGHDQDCYIFSSKRKLPVRWMAPECLSKGMFTPASDVWAYGVLLYEMITFGGLPYHVKTDIQVINYVNEGKTLYIPAKVNYELRTLMNVCWSFKHSNRPKASDIVAFFADHPTIMTPCLDVPLELLKADGSRQIPPVRHQLASSPLQSSPLLEGPDVVQYVDMESKQHWLQCFPIQEESSI